MGRRATMAQHRVVESIIRRPEHPVIARDQLSPNVTRLVVEAPRIAQIRQPGQFVIVHLGPGAERIPLTIADGDPVAGTITLIIQEVGKSTADLVELEPGGAIADIAGPLGRPTDLLEHGHAVCVGGGVGTAVILPIARELHARGVAVTSHRRRPVTRVGDPRARAAQRRRRRHLHRRRQLRPAGLRHGGPPRRARRGRRRRRLRRRTGADDARGRRADPAARRADDRLAQPDHGRRHRDVRRLPGHGRRPRPATPASTDPSSTPTRSTSTSSPTGCPRTARSRPKRWPSAGPAGSGLRTGGAEPRVGAAAPAGGTRP